MTSPADKARDEIRQRREGGEEIPMRQRIEIMAPETAAWATAWAMLQVADQLALIESHLFALQDDLPAQLKAISQALDEIRGP